MYHVPVELLRWEILIRSCPQTSDEQAFESFKTALSLGSTFWNSGAFYSSSDDKTANLKRIARFIEKYPEHRGESNLAVAPLGSIR